MTGKRQIQYLFDDQQINWLIVAAPGADNDTFPLLYWQIISESIPQISVSHLF